MKVDEHVVGGSRGHALLVSSLYMPNVGGVENSLAAISEVLACRGAAVGIVCSDLDQSSSIRLDAAQRIGPSMVYRYRHRTGLLGLVVQIVEARRLLGGLLRANSYETVIARSGTGVVALRLAGYRKATYVVPAISAYQNAHRRNARKPREWFGFHVNSGLQSLALRWAGTVVVLSENMRSQVERFTKGRVSAYVVPPGVDQARFRVPSEGERCAARRALGLPENRPVVLGLGRFSPVKGFVRGIRALKHLPDDVVLVLVGEGPCEQEYQETAQEVGVSDRVMIHPRTSTPEEYYRAADGFLFTSLHEPFGQVLLEASCAGLPVVAFRPGPGVETATEEIYRGFDALVQWADADDEASLPQALLQALARNDDRSGERSEDANRFRARYSWDGMVDELLAIAEQSKVVR